MILYTRLARWALLPAGTCLAISAWAQPAGNEQAAGIPDGAGTSIENAFRGALQDRSSETPDERLYVEKCSMCHRQMGMGTVILARRMDPAIAILEDRPNLPAAFVTTVVRAGMGNMPAMSRGEVSEDELARIADYLANGR
jgi:mono/diheme cytochrome c family protein